MTLTIVAIPAQDDRVWKLSSEKVPHLTILHLGDVSNVERVEEFVKHAADTMLSRFYLDVTERGVLGDKSADVVFFDVQHDKPLREFRRTLLTNTDILTAYSLVDQFPKWIPHLTMGYPETPAKVEEDPDRRGIYAVRFDRLALWNTDYAGREIPLKRDDEIELAMTMRRGEEYLQHYGVKGMKWGVIRSKLPSAAKSAVKKAYAPSSDAVKAQQFMTRAKLGGVRNLNNAEMQLVINRMNLERQYRELYGERQWHNAGKKWAVNLVTSILRDAGSSWLSNPFGSARRRGSDDPVHTTAWTNGQTFARVIEGQASRRSIGS